MSIDFRSARAEDAPAIFRSDGRAFGFIWTEEQQQERIASLPFERFQLALDGAEVVAVAGAMPFDMTMPGGATVPACGVTWVGVQATHRRRGLLTELMGRVHADALSRGEPVSILHASEAVIYGRFGYGVTTLERAVRIDRARTRWRAERPAAGAVRYADGPARRPCGTAAAASGPGSSAASPRCGSSSTPSAAGRPVRRPPRSTWSTTMAMPCTGCRRSGRTAIRSARWRSRSSWHSRPLRMPRSGTPCCRWTSWAP